MFMGMLTFAIYENVCELCVLYCTKNIPSPSLHRIYKSDLFIPYFFFFNLTLFWQPTKTPIMCFLQHPLLYSKLCDYANILKSVTQYIILLITMRTILTINVFMLHIWDVRLYH